MGFFQTLRDESQKRNLQFLVIGGLAVNLHGHPRDTADLDLLVLKETRPLWLDLFSGLGYTIYRDGGVFIQLDPPEKGAWPVDLMLVNSETFTQMMLASLEEDVYGAVLRIPSLDHLLALKVHALKNSHVGRFMKDFMDVENLIRIRKLNIQSEEYRVLFLKYGDAELYEKVIRATSAK